MSLSGYLMESFGTLKEWTIDALKASTDLIIDEAEHSLNLGDTTPLEQMRGSVVIASLAFGASWVTLGATIVIVFAMILTFFWGLGRWTWGLGQATLD